MGKPPVEKTPRFIDGWQALSRTEKESVSLTLDLLKNFPDDPSLRIHTPRGYPESVVSVSVDDDLRILVQTRSDDTILLLDVGNHERVYGE